MATKTQQPENHYREERFWGYGGPCNLTAPQERWRRLLRRWEGSPGHTFPLVVGLMGPDGADLLEAPFVPWDRIEVLLLGDVPNRQGQRELVFSLTRPQCDEAGDTVFSAHRGFVRKRLLLPPMQPHQKFLELLGPDRITSPVQGRLRVVEDNAMWTDICVGQYSFNRESYPRVVARIPRELADKLVFAEEPGKIVRRGDLLAEFAVEALYGLAVLGDKYVPKIDCGMREAFSTCQEGLLNLALDAWTRLEDSVEEPAGSWAGGEYLPRCWHAVQGSPIQVLEDPDLVDGFLQSLGPGADSTSELCQWSPVAGTVTGITKSRLNSPSYPGEGHEMRHLRIGDRVLGMVPESGFFRVGVGDPVEVGQPVADYVPRAARYGSLADLEYVLPGLFHQHLLATYARKYRAIGSGEQGWTGAGTLWPSHLLDAATRARSVPMCDQRPYQCLRENGIALFALERDDFATCSLGGPGVGTYLLGVVTTPPHGLCD